jgi:serine/threonine protein kinase
VPRFESVWVDALVQARILTPFQAAEINAGRGHALGIGPYVLYRRLGSLGYADLYSARHRETEREVRLAVVKSPGERGEEMVRQLELLAAAGRSLEPVQDAPCPIAGNGPQGGKEGDRRDRTQLSASTCSSPKPERTPPSCFETRSETIAPIVAAGRDGDRIWAACRAVEGISIADWLAHHGRFAPATVAILAKQMVVALEYLARAGSCHGDVRAGTVLLDRQGRLVLTWPGLREIVRPEEGFAQADIPPEICDGVPPERIAMGGKTTQAGDLFAWGCLAWHMLAGRTPIPGGDGLTKLRNGLTATVPPVTRYAVDVPEPLVGAIAACVNRDPRQRPASMSRLLELLGGKPAAQERIRPVAIRRPTARRRGLAATLRSPELWSSLPWWAGVSVAAIVLWTFLWLMPSGRTSDREDALRPAAVSKARPAKSSTVMGKPSAPQRQRPNERGRLAVAPNASEPAFMLKTAAIGAKRLDSPPVERMGIDNLVVLTSSTAPRPEPKTPSQETVELPANASEATIAERFRRLRAGQTLCGSRHSRLRIVVPKDGLTVHPNDLCFENIDFVRSESAALKDGQSQGETESGRPTRSRSTPSLLHVESSRVAFRNCSFQWPGPALPDGAAIAWSFASDGSQAELSLPSGRLRLENCVFYGNAAGVAWTTRGAMTLEADNVLHLAAGPMLRCDHGPGPDEPVRVRLEKTTLRDSGPLVEMRYPTLLPQSGSVTIEAYRTVLMPRGTEPILRFVGPDSAQRVVSQTRWTGRGTLLRPESAIAEWSVPRQATIVLDDALFSMQGIVRSEVAFAGEGLEAAACQAVRWQAPLASEESPGIDASKLPWFRTGQAAPKQ